MGHLLGKPEMIAVYLIKIGPAKVDAARRPEQKLDPNDHTEVPMGFSEIIIAAFEFHFVVWGT